MAELGSSLTAIDWLTRLKVGIASDACDHSWSPGEQALLDTARMCGNCTVADGVHLTQPNRKPGYSYSSLIYLAIQSTTEQKMTLSEIYAWICDKFPYYRTAESGWKVSFGFSLHII